MIRDFPHTVCVEEMKTIVTVQEAERMDKKRKRTKGTLPDDGIRRYLYFAVIPVVVLILVGSCGDDGGDRSAGSCGDDGGDRAASGVKRRRSGC